MQGQEREINLFVSNSRSFPFPSPLSSHSSLCLPSGPSWSLGSTPGSALCLCLHLVVSISSPFSSPHIPFLSGSEQQGTFGERTGRKVPSSPLRSKGRDSFPPPFPTPHPTILPGQRHLARAQLQSGMVRLLYPGEEVCWDLGQCPQQNGAGVAPAGRERGGCHEVPPALTPRPHSSWL